MICQPCRQRADQEQGCGKPCEQGCDCQHRARHRRTEEAKMGESVEG